MPVHIQPEGSLLIDARHAVLQELANPCWPREQQPTVTHPLVLVHFCASSQKQSINTRGNLCCFRSLINASHHHLRALSQKKKKKMYFSTDRCQAPAANHYRNAPKARRRRWGGRRGPLQRQELSTSSSEKLLPFVECFLGARCYDDPSAQFRHSIMSNLCNPMDCSMPGFPDHHELLELAQTHVH